MSPTAAPFFFFAADHYARQPHRLTCSYQNAIVCPRDASPFYSISSLIQVLHTISFVDCSARPVGH